MEIKEAIFIDRPTKTALQELNEFIKEQGIKKEDVINTYDGFHDYYFIKMFYWGKE